MANISRNTFNRIKHFVGVRLQQGVPLVDADWNELADIRKYELQAFLKWFVGNGVPEGNDGFRIAAVAGDNDFTITGGDGTAEGAGYCLVEGWDALIEDSLRYTAQPLFGNADLAAAWGVAELPALTTPSGDRRDTVYLDVWEREVNAAEDAELIDTRIGLETCVRTKREWVVRVQQNADSPPPAPSGHVFYPLATLDRPDGAAAILPPHITDRRRIGLKVGSEIDTRQITRDAFGDGYTLDQDGESNLKVSLREAINALLSGGLPATEPAWVSRDSAPDRTPTALRDSDGNIWVFWESNRSGNYEIWSRRYLSAIDDWEPESNVTDQPGNDHEPRAVLDQNGDIWLLWRSRREGNNDIWSKRYSRASGAWEISDQKVSSDLTTDFEQEALVDSAGNVWVFWHDLNGNIFSRRRNPAAADWDPDIEQRTNDSAASDSNPHAVVDSEGQIWLFWDRNTLGNVDIYLQRYDPATNNWGPENRRTNEAGRDELPCAVVDAEGDIWLFWQSTRDGPFDIYYNRFVRARNDWDGEVQLTRSSAGDSRVRALATSNGEVWAVWQSNRDGNIDIWYNRYRRAMGWTGDRQITTDTRADDDPWIVEDGAGDVWVVWESSRDGNDDIMYRKLIPEI